MNEKELAKVRSLLGSVKAETSGQGDRSVNELREIKILLAMLLVRMEEN